MLAELGKRLLQRYFRAGGKSQVFLRCSGLKTDALIYQILHLRARLEKLKLEEPRLRSRDQAGRLGVSEAELLSLGLGEDVIRLGGDFKDLLKDAKRMGYVMALTRNDHVVHERKGVYHNITFYEGPHNMGVAVNEGIDLRLFMNEWKYCLAVILRRGKGGDLHGLQFFDAYGAAVHKM